MSPSTATTWHRLEPRVRGADPAEGLRAAVHDPLWFLGRQWQVGELLGEDAASPVAVRVETAEHPLSRWRPAGGDARDYDPRAVPLEALVEREPAVAPTLRLRLDAWTRLVELLRAANLGGRVAALAAAHPLAPPRVAEDPAEARLRLLAGPGAGDGIAAARALQADPGGLPASVVTPFVAWAVAQMPAGAGDAWVTDRLEYRFSVGASADAGEVVLSAPEYLGGRLDWHDLDADADPAHALGSAPAAVASTVSHLLPARVRFPGMPATRFWEFEDAAVDLGAVSAAASDLGVLLSVEFATVFGNDWWAVPVRATFGSLVGVRSLVVRDTFGERVLVRATETAPTARGTAPWRMFRHSDADLRAGGGPAAPVLLLAPVVSGPLEGDALEELLLLRDEMANLAWAVERVVEGADGRPRNRSVEYGARLSAAPTPELVSPAQLVYVLQTTVPAHWIPLLPVPDPTAAGAASGAIVLQRGTLLTQDSTARPITAQGTLLEPDVSPWFLHEEEVPRSGARVRRIPAVARWLGGTTHVWISRRVGSGAGEGSSGLRFDLGVPPAQEEA